MLTVIIESQNCVDIDFGSNKNTVNSFLRIIKLNPSDMSRNRLGFSVREMQEQLGFVTSQFAQEQAKIKKADLEKARDAELRDIDHLKESDIDAYVKEYDRVQRKFYETSGDESRKLATNAE